MTSSMPETTWAETGEGDAETGAPASAGPAKNLIVMIADSAGFNTLRASRLYLGDSQEGPGRLAVDQAGFVDTAQSVYPLDTRSVPIPAPAGLAQNPATVYSPGQNYDSDPVDGLTPDGYPRAFDGYEWNRATYPDSANTVTAMMTGEKTYNNAVNVDGAGEPLLTVAELAKSLGKATGVVSDVQFSDATPAASGGARNVPRANRQEIAQEMFGAGVLDVVAGAGNPDYDDDGNPVEEPVYGWIGEELWASLKDGSFASKDGVGWTLLQDRDAIQAAGAGARLAMIAQAFAGTNYYRSGADPANEDPYTVPRPESSPTLTELSRAALNRLNADEDGLYLSIEGGAVDRAMHDNNFGRMTEEYAEFDDAVRFVVDWIDSPESRATFEDTLLIVTADHDHLLFGPRGETVPYQPVKRDRDGDGVPEYQWFGDSHSNQLVPLYARGAGAELVAGLADEVDEVLGGDGQRAAGSGRGYTDQAELGDFLLDQLRLGDTPAEIDWNALAAQVLANYEATGTWYV
jgi:alkaline phosphatase